MYKIYLYLEVLIFMTIYRIITMPLSFIINELVLLNRTAEVYSTLKCHFWQQRKVVYLYSKLKEEYLKKQRVKT